MSEQAVCQAEVGGYDGMWGVGCTLPAGHTGPHHDEEIVWRYHDDLAGETAETLEAIVRAVAEVEPMAYCPGDEMSGDWYECGFCGVEAEAISRYDDWHEVEHRESCPWRRAREWVDSNPT